MRLKYILNLFLIYLLLGTSAYGQNNECDLELDVDTSSFSGTAFFNYGSSARVKNQKFQTSLAVGQTFVGFTENSEFSTNVGFYTRYLLPPFELNVKATQGDLLDRIQLTWEIDALGPSPNEGFNIYRDGIFLATVGPEIRNYNDFNVIAGKAYIYSVRGINAFGEGANSEALGFQVPNGVVTGWVRSINDSPVPDALVTLMPMQGFSASFGSQDGAMAMLDNKDFIPQNNQGWTLCFWMKADSTSQNARIIYFNEDVPEIWSENGGISVKTSGGATLLTSTFADSLSNSWQHISITQEAEGNIGRLYVNGELRDQSSLNITDNTDSLLIGNSENNEGWVGKLDEFRIYNRRLNELDFGEVMEGTASFNTPALRYYWKMDEELGVKSYDIINRQILYFCGTGFDSDRPPVRTAAKTNEDGYYRIESASYGTGTTFLAEASKDFYMHRSLELKSNEMDHVTLPDFSLTKKTTIEVWINNASAAADQTILSKRWSGNEFRLFIHPEGLENKIMVDLNGTSYDYGNLGKGFQHLALRIDSLSGQVDLYHNATLAGSNTYAGVTGDWSEMGSIWYVGAHYDGVTESQHFNGLISEVAVYDSLLTLPQIEAHFNGARNMQESGLRIFFPFDEGNGNRVSNVGSVLLEFGNLHGATWSTFAPNQATEPHIFTPGTRQVTLNPSVTSVDQVDFTDRSTVPISGFVRYKDTDCFAGNVEILVNGAPFTPRIFTDSTGRFVIDFDPGTTAVLEPKFEDHTFVPSFWEVTNVNSPVAGIIFNDVTTRKISGQVAGGYCKKSIIKAPPGEGQGTVCVVKVSTTNGCLERIVTIDNQEGFYEFDNLPPVESMTVAIVEHSNPDIKTAFQDQGGSTVNLTKKDSIVDFIYFAPPEVIIESGLEPISEECNFTVLDQYDVHTITIRMKEQYEPTDVDDGVCFLDSASISIINGLSGTGIDTTLSDGILSYEFVVGTPNPSPPFTKTLQVVGTSLAGREASVTRDAIVTGIRNKENTFTTKYPIMPTVILRDPPGDGSSAFIEKNQKICKTTSMTMQVDNGGSLGFEVSSGPTIYNVLAPLGIGTINVLSADVVNETTGHYTFTKVDKNSIQTCYSYSEKISTSTSDAIIGEDADVYVGDGTNIIFGFADKVTFNDSICEPATEVVVNVEPGNFNTSYIYSGFHIKNSVIPNLEALAAAEMDSTTRADHLESATRWREILEANRNLRDSSEFIRNISFDSGINYSYSETSDTTRSNSVDHSGGAGINNVFKTGFKILDVGFTATIKMDFKISGGRNDETGEQVGVTTGYSLGDDDPGDAFSVDISMDTIFKTPVFSVRSGQSSCPWEFGTANREAPNLNLAPGSQFVATNIPANEAAVYELNLGNLSATNEDMTYGFSAFAGSNPDGAVIKLNGSVLGGTKKYLVPFGESQRVTLTIEKGPIQYDYDSLMIAMYSECELARSLDLGLPIDRDTNTFSPIYLGAHFIRPCTEIDINVPEQNWVVFPDPLTPGEDDIRRITISGYNMNVPDFKLVRIQYRRSDGDGAWINIPGLYERYNPNWVGFDTIPEPKPEILEPGFTQFFWDTQGLADGPYEVRAVAVCTGDASDRPGYSQIIKGKIDREPPSLVGIPQPSDGVLHVGDEVSFTFNQDVNCNKLIQADQLNPNNVGLYDASTGNLIDANITCVNNKIVIDPIFENKFFENKIMRAELHDIEDLTGNVLIQEQWEFYVDRNELAWLEDSIQMTKYNDESKTISAKIHNRGGYPVPYSMVDLPAWVHVSPDQGTLVANEIEEIFFTVDENVPLGYLTDSIVLRTEAGENPFFMGGDEVLNLTTRVICRPDHWILNPDNFNSSDYSFSMNFNLSLNIEGELSADIEDIVGAYVGDELRGVSKVEYDPLLDSYLAFITVYSNVASGETIEFQIWDASQCKLFAPVVETFPFMANDIQGTALDPIVLNTSGNVLRKIFIHPGWNWISFNLEQDNAEVNEVISSLSSPSGALIKNQTVFSAYSDALSSFVGSLDSISPLEMYQYNSLEYDSISMTGLLLDPATPIPVNPGWNWIGYIPNEKLPIDLALSSLTPAQGDLIKSQVSFAQYVDNVGWIGNLDFLDAPNGYLLKLSNPEVLTFPNPQGLVSKPRENQILAYHSQSAAKGKPFQSSKRSSEHWNVDPNLFEHSMNIIGIVLNNDDIVLDDGDEFAAFVDNEVRGTSKTIYIPSLDSYLLFVTVYANQQGELLSFKFFDSSEDKEFDILEDSGFVINQVLGEVDDPQPFNISHSTGLSDLNEDNGSLKMFPNPFSGNIQVNFVSRKVENVEWIITDVFGSQIDSQTLETASGVNVFEWTPDQTLPGGTYFITLKSEFDSIVRKILYIK